MSGPIGRQGWDLNKILRVFSRSEVKTPLSFFFKVIPYITAAWIAILYAPISEELKFTIIKLSVYTFGSMCAAVFIFAWFRPKNLVYGETGHRAEHKLEYGTEESSITEVELDALQSRPNKKITSIDEI